MRSAMRAASQLSGRGPTDVDVAPVPARKSDYDIWCLQGNNLHEMSEPVLLSYAEFA